MSNYPTADLILKNWGSCVGENKVESVAHAGHNLGGEVLDPHQLPGALPEGQLAEGVVDNLLVLVRQLGHLRTGVGFIF